MTAEGLHDKSAIAAELAYRDQLIEQVMKILQEEMGSDAVPDGTSLEEAVRLLVSQRDNAREECRYYSDRVY
jgi:hypothetical protein